MHENLDELSKLESEVTIEFKKSYNRLLETIRKYKFKQNSIKGFAVKQNRNSQIIMADLQRLNGIMDGMLQHIDSFLVQNQSNTKKDVYPVDKVILMFPNNKKNNMHEEEVNIVNSSLKFCIGHMNDTYKKLNDAMYTYYDDSKKADMENSAVRARNWKKERNNALHIILNVACSLSMVNNIVGYRPTNDKHESLESVENFMDYLCTRPNYYSYLSLYAQNKVTGIKKSRKIKKKINDRLKSKQQN